MTVYVDQIVQHTQVKGEAARYGKRWCHLWADSLEELHAFAEQIGMQRRWFQAGAHIHFCHYDLVPSRRERAIKLGAVEMSFKTYVRTLMDMDLHHNPSPPEVLDLFKAQQRRKHDV